MLYDRLIEYREAGMELEAKKLIIRFITPTNTSSIEELTDTHVGRLNEPHEKNSIVSSVLN